MSWPETETDLLAPVVPWLRGRGCKTYAEVQFKDDEECPVADIVTTKLGKAGVIEGKRTLSMKLIRQACYWLDYADAVSIVVPAPSGKSQTIERRKCHKVLDRLGVGLIEVHLDGRGKPVVEMVLTPKQQQVGRSAKLLDVVDPLKNPRCMPPKDIEPGNDNRRISTSRYQQTVDKLIAYVRTDPGCTIKAAIRAIDHHWPNTQKAISQLTKIAATESGIKGIRTEIRDGLLRLYEREAA